MGCLMLNGREFPAPKRLQAAPKPQFFMEGIRVSNRKLNKNSKLPPHSMKLSVDHKQLTTTKGIIRRETIPQSPKGECMQPEISFSSLHWNSTSERKSCK